MSPNLEPYFPLETELYVLDPEFNLTASREGTRSEQKQAVSPQINTLLETVISKTPVVSLDERVRRRQSLNGRTLAYAQGNYTSKTASPPNY